MRTKVIYNGKTLAFTKGEVIDVQCKDHRMVDDLRILVDGDVIDVDELPTENIVEGAVYRTEYYGDVFVHAVNGDKVFFSEIASSFALYTVATKPTENIQVTDLPNLIVFAYYIEEDNDVFVYMDTGEGLQWYSASLLTEVPFNGVYEDESQDVGMYLIQKYSFHQYRNGVWLDYFNAEGQKIITENGVFDVTDKKEVNVELPVSDDVWTIDANRLLSQTHESDTYHRLVEVEPYPTKDITVYPSAEDVRYVEEEYLFNSVTVKAADLSNTKALKGIYIDTFPKTQYELGDRLDVTSGRLRKEYHDGTYEYTIMINQYIVEDWHTLRDVMGTHTLTVEFTENGVTCHTTYQVTIGGNEASTEADMTTLLENGTVGSVYKYTGESTDTYENGAYYLLEESV